MSANTSARAKAKKARAAEPDAIPGVDSPDLRPTGDCAGWLSVLQPGRHVSVLALELHAGGERHRLHQRGEILLQVLAGILLQLRDAEMRLQHLARRRRHRHRHVLLAAELEAEIEILAQQF